MTQIISNTTIPAYRTGTWQIDTAHSDVSFSVRHMMVSKVRGQFTEFEGTIVTADEPADSSVTASIKLDSIDTHNEQRDGHIRSADFFDVAEYPTMTYRSTSLVENGDTWTLQGELSLHGVTRPVPLRLELNGFTADPYGGQRAGFSATAEINRRDFGIDISMPMDGGGVVVGDKISITLEIEAVLDQSSEPPVPTDMMAGHVRRQRRLAGVPGSLFSFPNPVNEVAARSVAAGVLALSVLTIGLSTTIGHGWLGLTVPLAYGFVARVLTGPTLSPLGQLATRVVAPRIGHAKLVAGPPKRFAQAIGATMSLAAAVLHFGFGLDTAAITLVALIAVAATLESVFAFCVGCTVFAGLMRVGLVPEEVCAACANISLRSRQPA